MPERRAGINQDTLPRRVDSLSIGRLHRTLEHTDDHQRRTTWRLMGGGGVPPTEHFTMAIKIRAIKRSIDPSTMNQAGQSLINAHCGDWINS